MDSILEQIVQSFGLDAIGSFNSTIERKRTSSKLKLAACASTDFATARAGSIACSNVAAILCGDGEGNLAS